MEIPGKDSKRLTFMKQLVSDERVREPIRNIVETLDKQLVLDSFICRESLSELNGLLQKKLSKFRPYISEEDFVGAFEIILVQKLGSKVYNQKGEESTIEDVCAEAFIFSYDINWAKVFEYIYGLSYMMKMFGYRREIEKYKNTLGVTITDVANVISAYKSTFLLGTKYDSISKEWLKEHEALRDSICIDAFLDPKFEEDAFINISRNYSKTVKQKERESIELIVISSTEIYMLSEIVAKLSEEGKEITEQNVLEHFNNFAYEKPMQIWAIYYVMLMHTFENMFGTR